jgi:hypothetical protein
MILYKDNKRFQRYNADDSHVLSSFKQSEYYNDRTRDEIVRLALFIAADEPNGLQSTCSFRQLNETFDFYCGIKPKL